MTKRHLIVALPGVTLFIWVIAHIDRPSIVQELKALRLALPIVLLLSLCRLLLQTAAWSQALQDQNVFVPRATLVGTRLASQGMGYLTVLGPALSEPMKIKLLGTPARPTITATLLDDGVYWLSSILVALVGWLSIPFVAVHTVSVAGVGAAVVGLLLILSFIAQPRPVLAALARKLGTRAPHWLTRAANLESSIRDYRRQRPALVRRMFRVDVACQLLIAAEVVVVLRLLHLPIRLLPVLAIEGVTRGLKLVSGWIPARLGSDEGGAVSAFALTGFSPGLGLALALTRRVRDLLWALIGLFWLVLQSRKVTDSQNHTGEVPGILMKEAFSCKPL